MGQSHLRDKFTHRIPKSVVQADELREHLRDSPTVLLLLCAVHVTGDITLLDQYVHRIGSTTEHLSELIANANRAAQARDADGGEKTVAARPKGRVAPEPEAVEELIDLICSVLASQEQAPYMGVTDLDVVSRMASLAAGREVSDAELTMCLEQSGFQPDQRAIAPQLDPPPTLNLAIIGAGMTGLDAAVKALDRGFVFEIFEKAEGIGGVWWSQTYPGIGVDTPSVFYSLSYEVEPEWSQYYPFGIEYQHYLERLAKKYAIEDHLRLNTLVTKMEWLDDDQVWELTVLDGTTQVASTVRAAAVLTAAGQFHGPKYPDVDGRESFTGEQVHSGKWRDIELEGKRVAVVGVGAAGIQVIPSLVPQVAHLTVFQRQAHWVTPHGVASGEVSDSRRWLRRHLPYFIQWERFLIFASGNDVGYQISKVDSEWVKTHSDSISPVNDFIRRMSLKYIDLCFGEGSELAKKLTPDFMFGGKRPVRDPGAFKPDSGGYYYAFTEPHVELETSGIAEVVPNGIVTADGVLHEVDAIVWCTGMTNDWLNSIEITGRGGVRLSEVWADNNPKSYLGGTVAGFPNLFVNDGPNTGVATGGNGHNFMAETVNHFVFECLQLLVENEATSIEVTAEAEQAHNDRIEELMLDLVWHHERTADTYYRNEAGRIIMPNPWSAEEYWTLSQVPAASKFRFGRRTS